MEASDLKRIRDLEDENWQLKRMFADLSLENRTHEGCDRKKSPGAGSQKSGRRATANRILFERTASMSDG